MKVYLSGRMSGLPERLWRLRFGNMEKTLHWAGGYKVINPANTIISRHPWLYRLVGYRFTLWYDLQLMKQCDAVVMVGSDWMMSRGARLERLKARKWKKKIIHPQTYRR